MATELAAQVRKIGLVDYLAHVGVDKHAWTQQVEGIPTDASPSYLMGS